MASYEDVGEGDQPYHLLGFGSFGVVTKVKRKSDQQVLACKSIRNIKMSKEQVQKEYDVIRKLHHQNVVQYVDMQVFPGETRLYMEYCNRSSLTEVIIKNEGSGTFMAEGYIWNLIHQLAAGVNYCHAQQPPVLHRDIKPGNVLLSMTGEGKVMAKLADFGLSTTLTPENAPSTYVGTRALMAPEVTNLSDEFIRWTEKCDIFSLGCTFYYISSYRLPFDWHLESDMTPPPLAADYAKRLKDCIMDTMSFDPSKRPSASDILRTSRSQQQDDFGIDESLSIIPVTIVKRAINDIGKRPVRKEIDKSAITETREVYDADGSPGKKVTNLEFRAKKKFLVIDNKPAEAPKAETFLEGGEIINATTMLPSQDTVQPGVNTKPTETITKAMQAPAQPQGHTLDDDDVIVGAVPGPPTWIRDRPRSEGPVKIARSSLGRRKGQSDLSKKQSAIALEETRRQQEIKQRKEATSRRGKADTKDRWEKNERTDSKKRRDNGEDAAAEERREKEPPVHKNRWALALEESRRRYEAKQRKDAKKKYEVIEEQRHKAVSGIADNWRHIVSEQARRQQEINPAIVVEEQLEASDEEQDAERLLQLLDARINRSGDQSN